MVIGRHHQVKSAQPRLISSGALPEPGCLPIVRERSWPGVRPIRRANRIKNLPIYRLRVSWREKHGIVRRPVRDVPVEAAGLREAVGAVLGSGSILSDNTNFAWLTDESENLVWTLRMDDQNAETT